MANPSRIPVRIPIGKADDRMLKVVTLAETEPVKGQLNSECIYEFIVSPKMPTKNDQDFCPTL